MIFKKMPSFIFPMLAAFILFWLGILLGLVLIIVDSNNASIRASSDFLFPLDTTKDILKKGSSYNGISLVWMDNQTVSYHHTYKAADLHVPEGTTVLAAKAGIVTETRNSNACSKDSFPYIEIRGDDGFFYLYSHLQENTIAYTKGDRVERGTNLGQVGNAACAQDSAPHLHFDISRYRWSRHNSITNDYFMIDPQPILLKAYEALP